MTPALTDLQILRALGLSRRVVESLRDKTLPVLRAKLAPKYALN